MNHLMRSVVLAGIFGLASTAAFADNLIQNGSFESGNFDHWTPGGAAGSMSLDASGAQDGTYAVSFGSLSIDSTLTQTVADTAGHNMQLTFWANSDGSLGNRLDVAVNGAYLMGGSLPSEGWTQYTLNFTATGTDAILFGGANGPSYNHLDNISLTDLGGPTPAATPEPSSLMLCGTGLLTAAGAARQRRKRR